MDVGVIGVGQAGGRIVDGLLAAQRRWVSQPVQVSAAVNTAKADLLALDRVPESNRVLLGESRVKGHGVGADSELAAEIVAEEVESVRSALVGEPVHETDALLLVAGLGGGTGGGGLPSIAEHLGRVHEVPVFGVGILPSSVEGGIYTLNAARAMSEHVAATDGLLLFDNDAWLPAGEQPDYDSLNATLVTHLRPLLTGDDASGAAPARSLARDDLLGTLSAPVLGVGQSAEEVETGGGGLLSRFTGGDDPDPDGRDVENRIQGLVRKATLGRLTLPCEVTSVDGAALVVEGPEPYLSAAALERGTRWLAEEIDGEVVGGLRPVDAGAVRVSVVLSVTESPRLLELQQVAVEAADQLGELQQADGPASLDEFLGADEGGDTRVYGEGEGDTRVYDEDG